MQDVGFRECRLRRACGLVGFRGSSSGINGLRCRMMVSTLVRPRPRPILRDMYVYILDIDLCHEHDPTAT